MVENQRMTAPAITSIAQDKNGKIATFINDDGLRTICLAQNARVVSQLVRGRLLTSAKSIPYAPETGMPWSLYIGEFDAPWQLLGSFLNGVIGGTYGVSGVDLSQAEYEVDLSRLGPVCFSIDCDNSQGEFELCL